MDTYNIKLDGNMLLKLKPTPADQMHIIALMAAHEEMIGIQNYY